MILPLAFPLARLGTSLDIFVFFEDGCESDSGDGVREADWETPLLSDDDGHGLRSEATDTMVSETRTPCCVSGFVRRATSTPLNAPGV